MKKPTKLTLIALLLALVMVMSVVVAACKDDDGKITEEEAKDTLQYYILSTNTAENDFTLPKVIGKTDDFPGIEVVWTSSDTKVIEIEDREGETYLAKVNQDSSAHAVTLTVKHKDTNASKDFTVTVPAFSVYSFTENYTFTRNGAVVSADFNLDTTYTFKGRDCTIVWTITELTLVVGEESSSITVADNQYVAIQDGVFKVKATPEEGYVDVKVNAKFTYNGENVDKPFGFKVQEAKDPQEENFVWYSEAGTVRAISGYVVGIATPFTTQNNYNNASIYVVTDDLSGGVYLFRTKGSVEDGALLEPGVHVTVSGVTSTEYVATGTEAPGLWETTQGSNFVIDGEKADVSTLVYALDNDATSGSPALKWHTGALVSLTNWKVKTVKEASTSKSGTLVTLEKDGAEIDISYSNYMEGFYTSEESNVSAELKAIKDEVAKYKEGDYVSVVGILSYFSGSHHFQILPRDAKDIKAGTADTTPTAGSKVTPAIKKVEEEFAKNVSGIVASPLNFAMPTSENGVTITYTVMGRNAPVAVDEQGNWTITPAKSDKRNIKVTYTVDKYVTYSFLTVRSESLTDEDKVAKAIKTIEGKLTKDFTEATDYTLPVDTDFGTTVEWTIKESDKTFAKIENGVLKVTLPQTESTFTLVLKVTLGQVEDSKEYTVTVAAAPTTVTTFTVEPMSEGDHYLGLYQSTLGKWLYGTTEKSGYYIGLTDDPSLAEKWTLAKVSGSDTLYTIKVGDLGYLEKDESGGDSYISLNAQPTEGKGWSWDAEHQAIIWTKADGTYYFLGNFGTNTTLSTSGSKYLGNAGNNIAAFGSISVLEAGDMIGITSPVAGTYKFGVYQGNLKKWLYATGEVNGDNFGVTTENPAQAADFTIAVSGDGYTIKVGEKFLELNSSHRLTLVDASTAVWSWNAEAKVFTFTVDNVAYYIGSYKDFNTFSASDVTYITGDKSSSVGVSNFVGLYGSIVGNPVGGGDVGGDEPDETNYGTADNPISVTEALAIAEAQCPSKDNFSKQRVFVTGILTTQPDYSGSYIKEFTIRDINDPNKTILVFSMNKQSGVAEPDQNDTVVLSGFIKNQYGTTLEFATNGSDYVELINTTRGQSTVTLGDHGDSTVTGIPETAQNNGSEITLNVTANTGKQIASVKVNGVALVAQGDGSYKFTLHGNSTVTVETANEGEVLPVLATTITFGSSGDMKDGASTTLVEFEKDGFNVKCEKGGSTSDCRFSDANEYRMYKDSKFTVSSEKAFVKLVFELTESKYVSVLETSIKNANLPNATVEVEGLFVTVTFDEPVTATDAITLSAQARVASLEIWTLPEA